MNTYKIQHKVHTLSQISIHKVSDYRVPPEFTIEGFRISPFEYNPGMQHLDEDAWIVEKEIQASNAFDALNFFRLDFNRVSPKIAFLSQCYFEYLSQSFLVLRLNNNPEKKFICKDVIFTDGVSLHFQDQEIIDFNILMNIEELKNNQVFVYLQDYYNSTVWPPRAMLLFSALEALAGRIEKIDDEGNNYFTYDKVKMKIILGNELYNIIFGREGLRHKLNHGDDISIYFQQMKELGVDYGAEIYTKIIKYFNNNFGLKISEEVVNPGRHFFGNMEYLLLFMKPKGNKEVNLFNCKGIKDNPDFTFLNKEDNY